MISHSSGLNAASLTTDELVGGPWMHQPVFQVTSGFLTSCRG